MLENTAYKLKHGLGLTVAYFGGSITEGAGASSYASSWAGLTTAWLRERFPACAIRPVQAAIGRIPPSASTAASEMCARRSRISYSMSSQ